MCQISNFFSHILSAYLQQNLKWRSCVESYVLIGSDQEAVMDVSLHQAGLAHALLAQHHHLGIHAHAAHIPQNLFCVWGGQKQEEEGSE